MSAAGKLDEQTLRRLFVEDIRPMVFADAKAAERPVVVIVGAQPGAGKTRVLAGALVEHPGAVEIMGDDLRQFHLAYGELLRTAPLDMPTVTAQASGVWVEMALAEARRLGVSQVVETTFRRPEVAIATAAASREAGFAVEVRALAVPPLVSQLSVVVRYVQQAEQQGVGRWAPARFHRAAVAMMLESIERLVETGLVNRMMVVTRDSAVLHDGSGRDGVEARRALDVGRTLAPMTAGEAAGWLGEYARCARYLVRHGERDRDVLATLVDLGQQGKPIVQLLYRGARSAAATELSDVTVEVRRLGIPLALFPDIDV